MKKSFYLFLCGLLGMLLFILLQRSLFLLAFLGGVDVLSYNFQRLDYFSFVAASLIGLWYGIWLGLHWYGAVYEEMSAGGFFSSLFGRRRPRVEDNDSWELDELVNMKREDAAAKEQSRGPRLEVFETNTVAFSTSQPVHADHVHSRTSEEEKPKRTVAKKSPKKTVKKVE